ncbi:MAG TPA: hypothetical protein EYN91_12710 [Candidatus Melainabacteria bacterium]|jgi:tyrosine-protein phosphatase SIW14|nr:hypothetical protein [Candidatus Melainabacteria bacterium]HIN65077.1 hypothetical protein [Candidatus Obscuribacterales bacterium]
MKTMSVRSLEIPITNFHPVAEGIYRGGRPSRDGLRALRQRGFKTVLSFRWRKAPIAVERSYVEELGMKFINIPLNYWSLPNQQEIDSFLAIIDDRRNYPIFVHCFHGADRTGLLMAIYRVVRCGWSFDEAYREMVACGFHRFRTQHYKWALWRLARKAAVKAVSKD